MIFTRNHLRAIQRNPRYIVEATEKLIAAVLDGVELTLAEFKFLGIGLNAVHVESDEAFSILKKVYDRLTDFHFWEKYGLYGEDLEGQYEKITPYGRISLEDKRQDVTYLEQEYQLWIPVIEKENHTDQLLQFLAIEARKTIKDIIAYSKARGDGGNHQKYIRKSLTLHSRYVYLKIKEYYQENPTKEEQRTFCQKKVVIDINTYVHIIFRHFGEGIMAGRPGKTYHHDSNIDIDRLPTQIFWILEIFEKLTSCTEVKSDVIFLNFNSSKYAIWLQKKVKRVKGNATEVYYRVSTFYPVGIKQDLDKINQLKLLKAESQLGFYI